ncbi:MAG: glycoside hydrolase family 108 protein [Candidatus Aminicenantes bacterium]|nr:glycoside hydrolase family 108 protein [Candidatus Aminicenantes bacterium]
MSRFDEVIKIVLGFEGGYSNDPDDPGGKTNYGITEGTFHAAKQEGIIPYMLDITELTPEQAMDIYRIKYWEPIKGDKLPPPLDLIVFDTAVNSGVGTAGKLLQKTLNNLANSKLKVDGAIGPKTLSALDNALVGKNNNIMLQLICNNYLLYRVKLYSDICDARPSSRKFLRGWIKQRIVNLSRKAGVLDD